MSEVKELNLYQRMSAITSELRRVAKKLECWSRTKSI